MEELQDKIDEVSEHLTAIKGVLAVGVAHLKDGPLLYAYVKNKTVQKKIPSEMNGVKIIAKIIGKISPA